MVSAWMMLVLGAAPSPSDDDVRLDPASIPKFVTPLVVPPAMPMSGTARLKGGGSADYYQIAVRQISQNILPPSMGLPPTTVWAYGSLADASTFNYPAFTIEARHRRPVRVQWVNQLVDANGHFRPHLFTVDPTLHWANPPGGTTFRDSRPDFSGQATPGPYQGPVPIVTHVHGARTTDDSDGFAEAWFLPDATDIPADFARTGTLYDYFVHEHGFDFEPGTATYNYPNEQRAATLWYHDHTLGMTRLNVYAGPAGFYLIRGGPADLAAGVLPAGPYEIPIAVQDRTFRDDGSLFYPADRAFFEGLSPDKLDIPFIPEDAVGGPSEIPPYWNPEFFGDAMVVNGRTWPSLEVEARRYRFRFLNGCNSRFLILALNDGTTIHQIGNEGGFLEAPVALESLLLAPAERADVIVDFTGVPVGDDVFLLNLAPDEPFGGGVPGIDFAPADPATTGLVMRFHVGPATGDDRTTPPGELKLPRIDYLPAADVVRRLALTEQESETVFVRTKPNGSIVFDPRSDEEFGPEGARLAVIDDEGIAEPLMWDDPITENPAVGATEIWEIHNFTEDAHPIHLHLVAFEVVERETSDGAIRPPEEWERGFKDTVIAYPDEITRIKARFDLAGLYVWHCHIVEHEDQEMMRPYHVGPIPPDLPIR